MDSRHITDQQQVLAALAREGSENRREGLAVVSPGGGTTVWAAKVKSHVAYNVYTVLTVVLGDTGAMPYEIGEAMTATNLAESFLAPGVLTAGTYAIVCRVADKNVFHVVP